ncbi:hypothetical protein DOTSEDRAFT_70412 [Dothistroma septosporum NZE10]|uniref:Uncharacterized protein n=1 Tax=Dothistroma septosporum (strain NZE10 / CBS 128990) TaxID=675120 RepID=N1PVM0_DOTSN|nr:hypothetical protein DOTSEDRAFT_70412 [Dothistroma septosporum NZE10]
MTQRSVNCQAVLGSHEDEQAIGKVPPPVDGMCSRMIPVHLLSKLNPCLIKSKLVCGPDRARGTSQSFLSGLILSEDSPYFLPHVLLDHTSVAMRASGIHGYTLCPVWMPPTDIRANGSSGHPNNPGTVTQLNG